MSNKLKLFFTTIILISASLQAADEINSQLLGSSKVSSLIGTKIVNRNDDRVGKIKDFVVDIQSGRVVLAIVASGGFLSWNEKLTAVPPQVLQYSDQDHLIHLISESGSIKNAPLFWNSHWTEQTRKPYLSEVYQFFRKDSAFNFIQSENVDTDNFALAESNKTTISTRNRNGTWTTDQIANQYSTLIPVSRLSSMQSANKLIGSQVRTLQSELIGKVDEILIDLTSGRLVVVMISDDTAFALADNQRAVPPSILHYDAGLQVLVLGASKAIFVNTPFYKKNVWPDFSNQEATNLIYKQYQMVPYYVYPVYIPVDNSAKNVRDQANRTLTPLNQGTSPVDIQISKKIRNEIMADERTSLYGKNIKIITIDKQVTLRGPVSTFEERDIIEQIADRIAYKENVDSQLEVKLSIHKTN